MSGQFLVDTNFWLSCAHDLYPMRHFPTFWSEMEKYLAKGTILLHWSVNTEIHRKDDDVKDWVDGLIKSGLLAEIPRPKDTPESYIDVCSWPLTCVRPHAKPYSKSAIKVFQDAGRADAWLCAQAVESGYAVVTRERPQPQASTVIKIPDVCDGLGISCLNYPEFFDAVGLVV